mmetsp:Transcript_74878/g.229116  ORF Transcript_74878/g.229116 Transcript_74878/m.229116 type:complete len:281 (-) Transcript_74878:237-1079(-)
MLRGHLADLWPGGAPLGVVRPVGRPLPDQGHGDDAKQHQCGSRGRERTQDLAKEEPIDHEAQDHAARRVDRRTQGRRQCHGPAAVKHHTWHVNGSHGRQPADGLHRGRHWLGEGLGLNARRGDQRREKHEALEIVGKCDVPFGGSLALPGADQCARVEEAADRREHITDPCVAERAVYGLAAPEDCLGPGDQHGPDNRAQDRDGVHPAKCLAEQDAAQQGRHDDVDADERGHVTERSANVHGHDGAHHRRGHEEPTSGHPTPLALGRQTQAACVNEYRHA